MQVVWGFLVNQGANKEHNLEKINLGRDLNLKKKIKEQFNTPTPLELHKIKGIILFSIFVD